MSSPTRLIPGLADGNPPQWATQELTDSGAITIPSGFVVLNKAGVIAATLAAPTANGQILIVVSETAQAHTLDLATSGINGGSADVGTFGGAIGDGVGLISHDGVWYSFANTNVTFA